MVDVECLVVGGGIAGLAAAYFLRDRDVLLLEGSERLGGRIKSVSRGDYWANLGAQFVAPQGALAELAALPGVTLNRVVGDPKMSFDGRMVKATPFDMMVRSGLSIPARTGLARFGLQLQRDYRKSDGKSDKARSYRLALDDRRASELFPVSPSTRPILDALSRSWLSAELSDVSGAHATNFFHHGMASGKGMSDLTFPTHGSETVVRAVAAALEGHVRVETQALVHRVTPVADGVEVEYEQAGATHVVTARTVVMAAPAYAARAVTEGLPAEYVEALHAVNVGAFITAAFFTNETTAQPWDRTPMITAPGLHFQTVFNPVSSIRRGERRPGGSLDSYAGGDSARDLMDASDDEIRAVAVKDLGAAAGVEPGQIDEVVVQRWPKAMPYWGPGGYARMRALRRPAGRISFAGDYLGLPGMPSAAAAGKVAADSVLAALTG